MRTTLTLDEDVAAMVEHARKETGEPLKKVINDALRAGLAAAADDVRETQPFRTKTWSGGEPLIPNLDNVHEVLDQLEGPWRK